MRQRNTSSGLARFVSTSALVAACGAALAATGIAAAPAPTEAVAVRIVDSNGVEHEIDPSTTGIDFAAIARAAMGGGSSKASGDGKSWSDVSEGYKKVESAANGQSFYGIWVNNETNEMLAELPRGFENQKHYFALTVSGGEIFAGLQSGELYCYWKRVGKDRLALVEPQLEVRSSGDAGTQDSVKRIFTDRVITDVAIVTTGPNGQPVIDMDDLLVNSAATFFGGSARGLNSRLAEIDKAKAFPDNVELAYAVPTQGGIMKTFHYSISNIRGSRGFQPREADSRLGYFTTSYRDLGEVDRDAVAKRYINRWNLEKADKSLKLSPPKEPIVYYIEHTVPVRYRRWVRAGVEYWNEAYRNVGIDGAIQVRFQDKATGQHMDKDPEDVRYNFIRWLNNDISTAIGPSRVDPNTGEILDADVVLTDGWLRVFTYRWNELLPDLAMEGFDDETMRWFEQRPQWDPRVRLASPVERQSILAERKRETLRGVQRFGGQIARVETELLGDDKLDGLVNRVSQVNGFCDAATGKAMHLASAQLAMKAFGDMLPLINADEGLDPTNIPPEMLEELKKQIEEKPEMLDFLPPEMRAQIEALLAGEKAEEEGDEEAEKSDEKKVADKGEDKGDWKGEEIDGMPESFVGPMLAELVAHEVGHTLGLRHNFQGSSAYTLAEINSEEFKGKKPWSSSVMDYNGINIRMPMEDGSTGEVQGDYSSTDIGPYDLWVIEYGYGSGDLKKVLARSGEPELAYGTDEDANGPDPYTRRYDLSKNPIDWARNQIKLVEYLRENLLDKFVEEGDNWGKARRGYQISLGQQVQAVSAMANWIGGAHVDRSKKGDAGAGDPITPVEADKQREAVRFVIDNTFNEDAYGLTPKLLRHMSIEKWYGSTSVGGSAWEDNNVPVHDLVLGVQSSAMSMLLNPTTLRRVHDNQAFFSGEEDTFRLGEMMRDITDAAWSEVLGGANGDARTSSLAISSLRQNLQREHADRLIDLTMPGAVSGAASKPVAALAAMHLRDISEAIDHRLEGARRSMNDEVRAHLLEVKTRIAKALDAQYIYNTDDISTGGGTIMLMLGQDGEESRR